MEPQEKKKTPKGRAKKRITYTRRFVNVTMTGGKRKVSHVPYIYLFAVLGLGLGICNQRYCTHNAEGRREAEYCRCGLGVKRDLDQRNKSGTSRKSRAPDAIILQTSDTSSLSLEGSLHNHGPESIILDTQNANNSPYT